jgi:hypothetical protein
VGPGRSQATGREEQGEGGWSYTGAMEECCCSCEGSLKKTAGAPSTGDKGRRWRAGTLGPGRAPSDLAQGGGCHGRGGAELPVGRRGNQGGRRRRGEEEKGCWRLGKIEGWE